MARNANKLGLIFSTFLLLTVSAAAQNRPVAPDVAALVKGYTGAWREADPVKREQLLAQVWAPDGVYTDSQAEVKGRQKLVEHIGMARQLTPSSSHLELSPVESHHGRFRFAWRSVMPDGTLSNEGMDFGELDQHGRIRRLAVFFGPLTPVPQTK